MNPTTEHFRCSDDARTRDDRSIGTAPPARNWFLVEQARAWGPTAWAGLDIPADAKNRLEKILSGAGARLMLIRRPGRETDALDAARRWCVVRQRRPDSDPTVVWGIATGPDELVAAAGLFDDPDLDVVRIPPPAGHEGSPQILLVCTHGQKDVCCAIRGRPVAERAAELWPAATWETTHTGGDRFAGNMILLPDGACYGGLDPEDVEGIIGAHVAGAVDPAKLRGPTGHTGPVQAAMVEAYARFAPLPFHAPRLIFESGPANRWRVRLDIAGVGIVDFTGHTETTPAELLTCKAIGPKVMQLPRIDTVEVVDGRGKV